MRHNHPAMAHDAVTEVDALLDSVRADHQVHIPLAIESGSRVWGFRRGRGEAPPVLIAFIQQELDHGAQFAGGDPCVSNDAMQAADALYASITRRLDQTL